MATITEAMASAVRVLRLLRRRAIGRPPEGPVPGSKHSDRALPGCRGGIIAEPGGMHTAGVSRAGRTAIATARYNPRPTGPSSRRRRPPRSKEHQLAHPRAHPAGTAASSPNGSSRRPSSTRCSTADGWAPASTSWASSPRSACRRPWPGPTACPACSWTCARSSPTRCRLVPKALAARHKVFPYRVQGKTLFLLMVDPSDHAAVATLGYSLGYIVKTAVVPEFRMIQLLRDYYGVDERWRFTDTHRRASPLARDRARGPATAAARLDAATTRDEVVEAAAGALPALLPAGDLLHREGALGAGLERRGRGGGPGAGRQPHASRSTSPRSSAPSPATRRSSSAVSGRRRRTSAS